MSRLAVVAALLVVLFSAATSPVRAVQQEPAQLEASVPPPETRAAVAALVGVADTALLRAHLGANILREQALTAPSLVSRPAWQYTTAMAVEWLRLANSELQLDAVVLSGQPVGEELAHIGDRLRTQADAFAAAASAGDADQLQVLGSQLDETVNLLASASVTLSELAVVHGVGD